MDLANARVSAAPIEPIDSVEPPQEVTFPGHPRGLFVLFLVEMWERFSYYGMRALLVLYLIAPVTDSNPGRGWSKESAANLYGWYAGMAYLLPILGGLIADKLIGAHRSMLIGGILITLGHLTLAVSGLGTLGASGMGMSVFVLGLALIVIGTGHFKPNVSVMVGGLYRDDDPRRDSAFTIFYMGINIGAFVCAFVCGTLGEKVGWHWGFGSAAVGMLVGLSIYTFARTRYLDQIGEAPPAGKPGSAPMIGAIGVALAVLVALAFHTDSFAALANAVARLNSTSGGHLLLALLQWGVLLALVVAPIWFVAKQKPGDHPQDTHQRWCTSGRSRKERATRRSGAAQVQIVIPACLG